MKKLFKVLDPGGTGHINMGDYLRGLKLFGQPFSIGEAAAFMKMMGCESKDDDLNYEEFIARREDLMEEYETP